MKEFSAQLIQRIQRTPTVESFRFAARERVQFLAGQFLQVFFDPANPKNKDLNKYLSFSSSPTKDYFELTKRMSGSAFSAKLRSLKTGDTVVFKAPFGNCVFKESYKKIGFLIGGIGITPVISILEYIVDTKSDADVLLLYSNSTEEEIAFKKELDQWQAAHPRIRVVYTITSCAPQDERCERGYIDKELLHKKTDDVKERIFYIFGPPKMVDAMRNICLESECVAENIKIENFVGY